MLRRSFLQQSPAWAAAFSASALPAFFPAAAPAQPQRPSPANGVPGQVQQLVVAVAETWNSPKAKLLPFSRSSAQSPWEPAWSSPIPVNLGKAGLAWGNGALPVPHGEPGVPSKREKDQRAPAGIFKIGILYGDNPASVPGVRLPIRQVTSRDCWIDNPEHPAYNRHVEVDPANPPPWYKKQRMRLGDFAYEFLLEIRHNADPPIAGHGSAIFFHIRRGVDRPSHGCTVMARQDLVRLIRWLDARAHPHYVLLPRKAYGAFAPAWGLPPLFV